MQAIINGEMYEVEPAVKVIIDKLMIENAELKKENARLEEGYQKSLGVIAATDCVECKDKSVKHGRWLPHKITASSICSLCKRVFADETPYCPNCGAKMDGGADNDF